MSQLHVHNFDMNETRCDRAKYMFVCLFVYVFEFVFVSFLQSNSNSSQNKLPIQSDFLCVLELKCYMRNFFSLLLLLLPLCHLSFCISWMRISFPIRIDCFKLVFTISTDSWANLWLLAATTKTTKNDYPHILLSCLMEDSQVLSLFISIYFRQNAALFIHICQPYTGMDEKKRNKESKSHKIWLF